MLGFNSEKSPAEEPVAPETESAPVESVEEVKVPVTEIASEALIVPPEVESEESEPVEQEEIPVSDGSDESVPLDYESRVDEILDEVGKQLIHGHTEQMIDQKGVIENAKVLIKRLF